MGGTSTPTPTTSASSSTLPNPGGSSRELILEIDQTWSQEPSGYTRSDREERKKIKKIISIYFRTAKVAIPATSSGQKVPVVFHLHGNSIALR